MFMHFISKHYFIIKHIYQYRLAFIYVASQVFFYSTH